MIVWSIQHRATIEKSIYVQQINKRISFQVYITFSSQTFSSSLNVLGAVTMSLALVSQRQYAIRKHRTPNKFTRKADKCKHKFTHKLDKFKGCFYVNIKASEFTENCIENLKQRCCDSDHKLITSDKK